ncbi:putative Polycomb group protein asxl2 [Mactra antiquata]
MSSDNVKSKQTKRKPDLSWAEAAKLILESHPKTPMSYKEILKEIQIRNLKEISPVVSLACLNSCLHAHSRTPGNTFYKVAGQIGIYGLMADLPPGTEILEVDDDIKLKTGLTNNELDENIVKQKVIYAKLPESVKTMPGTSSNIGNGVGVVPSVITIPAPRTSQSQSTSKLDVPTRRSVRQAQRKKRKHGFIPKITIKPLIPPKSEEGKTSSSSTSQVRYVATPSRPVNKVQVNNHKQHVSVNIAGSQTNERKHSSGLINNGEPKKKTLREMLAGIPGFSMKPRKRTNKKLSHAAQIAQTMEGCIDLETPDSILVNTNLKGLLTKHNFSLLPSQYQYKLITLLPECDKIVGKDSALKLSSTALNNEFFAKACNEWRERLSEGEFTPENQQRLKQEEEKEQIKLDPWKAKHFEPVWGQKTVPEVPKADDIQPSGDSPIVTTPSQPVRVTSVKKPTLVSTMLKQRTIYQNVQGYSSAGHLGVRHETVGGLLMKLQGSKSQTSISEQQRLVQASKRPVGTQASDNTTVTASPPKRQKIMLTSKQIQTQAHTKTLAQIRAQTQVARMQKSENKLKVSGVPTVVTKTLSPGTEPHVSKPLVVNVPSTSCVPGLKSPTRTLAQIKSQTQAAKAKVQNQTRTLAQIKAETKARVQNVQQQAEAQAKLHAHLLAKARGTPPHSLPSVTKTVQSANVPVRQKQTKAVEPDKTVDGVNLKRSLEICEQAKILSQKNAQSPGTSTLQKPAVQATAKSIVSPIKSNSNDNIFGSYLKADIAKAHKTVSQILQDKTIAEQQRLAKLPQSASIIKSKTNIGQPKFGGPSPPVINVPSTSVTNVPTLQNVPTATLNTSNVSFVVLPPPTVTDVTGISPAVFSVPSTRYVISSSAAASRQNLLQQLIRSAAGSQNNAISPQRAASAPPQQKVVQRVVTPVSTFVRSASVGTSAGSLEDMDQSKTTASQNTSVPGDIIVQIPSDQMNFLSKTGTAIIPGVNGSKPNSPQVYLSSSGSPIVISPAGNVIHSPGYNGSGAHAYTVLPSVPVSKQSVQTGIRVTPSGDNVIVLNSGTDIQKSQPKSHSLTTNQDVKSENSNQSKCACNLKGMKICSKCGAFCHDDCIGASKLCVTCLHVVAT